MLTPEPLRPQVDVAIERAGEGLRVILNDAQTVAGLSAVGFTRVAAFAEVVRNWAHPVVPFVLRTAFGTQNELFGGPLPHLLATARSRQAVLRLKLRDPELHAIPWEMLLDPEVHWWPRPEELVIARTIDVPEVSERSGPAELKVVEAGPDLPRRVAEALARRGGEPVVSFLFPINRGAAQVFEERFRSAFAATGDVLASFYVARWRLLEKGANHENFAPVLYVRAGEDLPIRRDWGHGLNSSSREELVLRGELRSAKSFSDDERGESRSVPHPGMPIRKSLPAPSPSARGSAPLPRRPEPPAAARGELYPNVTSTPADEIEPDQIVTFVLRLDPIGPSDLSPLAVDFPRRAPKVGLRAILSSTSFLRPEGEPWEQTFTVDRRLATRPAEWEVRAKALGDQPSYALTISFDVGDTPAGAYEVRLRRKGAPELPGGRPSGGLVRIPRSSSGAGLVLKITAEGTQYRMRMLRRGEMVADAPWPMSTEGFFTKLETANGPQDLWRFGAALYASLPAEVTDALDDPALEGLPLLIASSVPVAPFELLRLRPRANGPYLGIDRPVLRWTDKPPMPDLSILAVTGAACIRPEYPPPDHLPSAAQEENELRARFPRLSIEHVAMLAQLDALLQKPAVQLIHFAGHADGNPAKLTLQDAKVEPAYFDPGTPLMNGGPFLFLNGCRAATGRTHVPEFQANMLKMLLVANCTGAVAPLTKVESEAALVAACTFYYEVAARGKTVGEAVQAVRGLAFAEGVAPKHIASYLSYLAFAPPRLRLFFSAAR